MTLHQTIVETSKTTLFDAILENGSNSLLSTGFDEALTEALITELGERDDPPNVRLLTTESVLKWVRDDFILASEAADLVENEVLSIRTGESASENQLLITEESVISLVTASEHTAGLPIEHEEFVAAVDEKWDERWDQAEEFSLRAPARSRVEETLSEEFGSEVEADFRAMLNAIGSTREEETLSVVDACLLVAAKHELLLYDISKWGEEVGVASKATFSRRKTSLEESGLIETEKVPIEVGRPRLRLLLGEDELQNADIDDISDIAQRLLSKTSA